MHLVVPGGGGESRLACEDWSRQLFRQYLLRRLLQQLPVAPQAMLERHAAPGGFSCFRRHRQYRFPELHGFCFIELLQIIIIQEPGKRCCRKLKQSGCNECRASGETIHQSTILLPALNGTSVVMPRSTVIPTVNGPLPMV